MKSFHAPCTILDWDTEFFGFKVAEVTARSLTEHEAILVKEWAFSNSVDCVYLLVDDEQGETVAVASKVGFRFVDLRLEMRARLPGLENWGDSADVRCGNAGDLPWLQELAQTSHTETRFFMDRRFPPQRAAELYARWIAQDLANHRVFVAEKEGQQAGYLSARLNGETGIISLVAVAENFRKLGIGRKLVAASLEWFRNLGLSGATVVTQGNNIPAQHLYQSMGFRTISAKPRMHLWLDSLRVHDSCSRQVNIPFNRSSFAGKEMDYIEQALASGQISGDQTFSKNCQELLRNSLGVPGALVTTSCTHALEMAALLLNIKEGDEVILPDFTFVSTANAFVLRGAKPVFCDIRPDTLNLDERMLEDLISPLTRAIIPVHYAGVGCEMDAIIGISERWGIPVVEDNAHGLFGKYKGRWLGTMGSFATQSFHETKNITCGEGGALLINDQKFLHRAEIIREKGTDRARFFRGEIDKYSWVDAGSSYVMSDVLAAFLFGQLKSWETIQARRQNIWMRYDHALADWSTSRGIIRPFVPQHCEQAWHMYYLLAPDNQTRDRFIEHMNRHGIKAVFHYLPLHLSSFAKMNSSRPSGTWKSSYCPVSADISNRIVRLPFFLSMSSDEQDFVIEKTLSFFK